MLKKMFFKIASIINYTSVKLKSVKIITLKSRFTFTKFRIAPSNKTSFINCTIENSYITVNGKNNIIDCNLSLINRSKIIVTGINNKVVINKGVKLRKAEIIIRGEGCSVVIGNNTTFGSVRMVNAGKNNEILIGENCLFADQIEIWASDTHSIYNELDQLINKEKPVIIGDKVWIGSRVIILKGVHIGDGSIVGMGTTLTKDVPAAVVIAGSPPRIIKENVHWSLSYEDR